MSKGDNTPAPDFKGLADQMGAWNLGATNAQTMANRPNQFTPWGSTTWSQAPGGWNGPGDTTHKYPGPNDPGGPGHPGGPLGGGGATGGGGGSGGGPATGGGGAGGGGHTPLIGPQGGPGGFSSGDPNMPQDPSGGMNGQGANPWGIGATGGSSVDMGLAAGSGGANPAFQGGPQSNIVQRGPSGPPPPGGGPSWTPPPWQGDPNPMPPPGGWGQSGPGGHPGNPNFGGGGTDADPYNPAAGVTAMPGQWSQTTTLNPELQAAADAQMKLQNRRSGFGLDQFSNLSNAMKNPFSLGGLPSGGSALDPNALSALDTGMGGRNRAEDALYGRSTSRLDPQWGQQEEQLRTRLANQGLDPTSEAFQKEMGNFGRSKNDAYSQAMQNAIAGGGQEQALQFGMGLQGNQQKLGAQAQGYGQAEQSRGRTLSELLQQRELPINEMNALMNGQNVSMPQFGPFMGAGAAQSPNYLGAGQAQGEYNLGNNAQQMAMWGEIGKRAGGLAGLLPYFMGG